MNLYTIKFADGSETEELGRSVSDVREFLARSFPNKEVLSIELFE